MPRERNPDNDTGRNIRMRMGVEEFTFAPQLPMFLRPPLRLTFAERAVIALVLQGKSVRQIARERHTREITVRNHQREIFKKLGIRTREELVALVNRGAR